jgi:hypothetical protein
MKGTRAVFAPESRNMTTRFPDAIIEERVGQEKVSLGVVLKGGMYAISAIPTVVKSFPQIVTLSPSGFVNKMVMTTVIHDNTGRYLHLDCCQARF